MSVLLQPLDSDPAVQNSRQDGAASYHYKKLESEDSIRLLKLYRGQGRTIKCSLHRYRLSAADRTSYRALSYTWSQDAPHSSIQIHDKIIKIRKNLRDALRAIRDENSDCWLWIDAVCINQDSPEERNSHVKLMTSVGSGKRQSFT